jgi:hypothetical protein
VAEFLRARGELAEVWAKLKAVARRKRRETERRGIQTSLWTVVRGSCVHEDFTPAMRGGSMGLAGGWIKVDVACQKILITPYFRELQPVATTSNASRPPSVVREESYVVDMGKETRTVVP